MITEIVKKVFPKFVYNLLKRMNTFRYCLKFYFKTKKMRKSNKKMLFLLMTPEHKNLGDHAIAKAELNFLSDYNVCEITEYQLSVLSKFPQILKKVFKKDLLVFNGGGYLGTLWFAAEELLRMILDLCKSTNRIIMFTQTIFYENNAFGKEEFEKSKEIYNSCKNFILTSREKHSYEIMKDAYKNVYLIPDIVLSLNDCKSDCKRAGIQFTLRNDVEKTMADDYREKLISFFESKYDGNISFADMGAESDVAPENRDAELDKHFDKFRSAQLVVTDRLHGMIFSAITDTPCIVLNSKSPKVQGVYNWIFKDCEYIIFTDDFDEMNAFTESIKGKTFVYDTASVKPYFDKLKDIVKREMASE